MRRVNTFRVLGLCAMLALGTSTQAQTILTGLSTPDSLDHFELGEAAADDYGALPYGDGHLLFLSNREGSADSPLVTQKRTSLSPVLTSCVSRISRPCLMNSRACLPDQKYYIGLCALLPDSSGIIASHSRPNPIKTDAWA